MLKTLCIVLFALVFQSASAETLLLTARPGEYSAGPIGDDAETLSISTSFRITAYDSGPDWPTAAHVGFFQGENRNESFQFIIVRNDGNAPYLTAGYRIVESGEEAHVKSLAYLGLDSSAIIELEFNKGVVTVKYGKQESFKVKTNLTRVTPYVSVSSGSAEFEMRP